MNEFPPRNLEPHSEVKSQSATVVLITKKMAAKRLSISTRTLDRIVLNGGIEKVYVAGSVRFRSVDIDLIVSKGI